MIEQIAEAMDQSEIVRRQGFTITSTYKFRLDWDMRYEFSEFPQDCRAIFLGNRAPSEYHFDETRVLGDYLIYDPAKIQAVLVHVDDIEKFVSGTTGFGWKALEASRPDDLTVLIRDVSHRKGIEKKRILFH